MAKARGICRELEPQHDVVGLPSLRSSWRAAIDSGFGLLHGEVMYLSATPIAIDMTLAGLFWAMGGEEMLAKRIRKTLYVGAFAYVIGKFNALASIVFGSFAGLGLRASRLRRLRRSKDTMRPSIPFLVPLSLAALADCTASGKPPLAVSLDQPVKAEPLAGAVCTAGRQPGTGRLEPGRRQR